MGNNVTCTTFDILANVDGSQTRKKLDIDKIGIQSYYITEDIMEKMIKRENELWTCEKTQNILTTEDSILLGMYVIWCIRIIILNEFEIKPNLQQSAYGHYLEYIEHIKKNKTKPIVNEYIRSLKRKKTSILRKNQKAPDVALVQPPPTKYDPHDEELSAFAIDRFRSNTLQSILGNQRTTILKKKETFSKILLHNNSNERDETTTTSTKKFITNTSLCRKNNKQKKTSKEK